jgi:hypothetical protein
MGYRITGVNDSADGMTNGVRSFTAHVSAQADLADIDWMPPGSYAIDNTLNVYPKDPETGHWILPAASPILITLQPVDMAVTEGVVTETIPISAYAQDTSAEYTCTYAWYSCDNTSKGNPSSVAGQTSNTLTIPTGLQHSVGTYYYYCTITANSITLDTSVATVTVAEAEA